MEWISVKDRLPYVIGNYIIYGGEDLHYIAWAFFNSKNKWVDFNKTSFYETVTHWMPLPEPPTSNQGEQMKLEIEAKRADLIAREILNMLNENKDVISMSFELVEHNDQRAVSISVKQEPVIIVIP